MQLEKELISWEVKLRDYSRDKEIESFKEKLKKMGRRKKKGWHPGITLGRGGGSDCKVGGWSILDLGRAHMADLAMSPQWTQDQAGSTGAGARG